MVHVSVCEVLCLTFFPYDDLVVMSINGIPGGNADQHRYFNTF